MEKMNYGFLTTARFEQGRDLWMLATGTGVAPFISILHELDTWESYDRIVLVYSVRHANELAYELERRAGVELDHERSRIMICGNPEMVDDTRKWFIDNGYTISRRARPGHLALENLW